MSILIIVLIIAGFFPAFILLWVGVILLLSWLSGWNALGKHYREVTPFEGERLQMVSGRLRNGVNYRAVLTMGANSEGISLTVFFPFRIGHPPLFIPWSEISISKEKLFFMDAVGLRFSAEPTIKLILMPKVVDQLLNDAPAHLKRY